MYRKILVPLDGSELAELVLPYSIELADRFDADIILFSVVHSHEKARISEYRTYLESIAKKITSTVSEKSKHAISVSSEVSTGYPAEEILRYAETSSINLIVMATHGYSGIRRWALGSTADKVLRKSPAPVLLVRAGITPEMNCGKLANSRIIVLLDGSELAESVLAHVKNLTKSEPGKQEVVLLRVCEPPIMPSYYPPNVPAMPEDFIRSAEEGLKSAARHYLAGIEAGLKEEGLTVSTELLSGNPAEEILTYTGNHPCNLIVMSTHGRSGITRWVLGSVAERILAKASSPILLIRPKAD